MFKKDKLTVHVSTDRQTLGRAAAASVAQYLRAITALKEEVNVIFAAAPSQNEFLAALVDDSTINWGKVNAFHMDEYLGLPADAPQGFGNFLRTRLFEKVPFSSVHYLGDNINDYTQLLELHKPDIVCMGIGENTHIAFNDPPADFDDTELVKKVELDMMCRQQQVNDGCFASLDQVPTHAITLTIPALLQAEAIFCMVPGPTKRQAVYHTLTEPVSEAYPSTILRTHANAILFVDEQSYQPI